MTAYRSAVLDVDGTLVRGDRPLSGAIDAVETVRAAGIDTLFFSNNPIQSREAYRDRLVGMGFSLGVEEFVTSGSVTADYLSAEYPDGECFVVGEPGLRDQIRRQGISITDDPDRADLLVASIDREFTYDRLAEAFRALSDESVAFVGTDPDRTIPIEDRLVPGSGAIINAIAGVADRDPDRMMGKPSPAAIATVERAFGHLDDCLIVGDRLDTDLAMGERAGMTTVLVRTGVTDDRDLAASGIAPDHVLDSIADIDDVLDY